MLLLALVIVVAAVYLMARRVEVRLVLLGAGLALAALAGRPLVILDEFTRGMVAAMVAPICAAMGFAAVLRATGCDRDLVHLLLAPVRRFRWLVLPGGILAAYVVNAAVPSQTSTAAALGPILLPLMLAAGIRPESAAAALVLGASFGGDLLNPGAQDIQGLAGATGIPAQAISARVVPASLAGVLVATLAAAALLRRGPAECESDGVTEGLNAEPTPTQPTQPPNYPITQPLSPPTQSPNHSITLALSTARALIPLLPVALLLLAYGGWKPLGWLLSVPEGSEWARLAGALPVVRAMLIGVAAAVLTRPREVEAVARSLFEGQGAAYGGIISLTIAAQCFGAGIAAAGLSAELLRLAGENPALIRMLSAGFPWALAVLSGSGSGPVLTFGQTFLAQAGERADGPALAALACLAGAFGRTMSPVAAVVVYASGLSGVPPLVLVRRLLPALLAGAGVALATAVALPG